ncbi:MAG TPA: HAMP domain-containing sensor histidine kinase [Micromonosporaceae bacterium]|nr:HAMP domain-containing sensor histidine kinase [Micromonosporaceae bacterium]
MSRRTVVPGRFRRRLTVAFVIVAGVSALTLALGSYLLVRQARLDESLDRATTDLRYQLVLAEQFLPLDPERSANLLGSFERSGRHVVLREVGRSAASNPAFDPVLPTVLRSSVAAGRLAYHRLDVDGRHLLVVGARIRASAAELYVIHPEDAIHDDLAQLSRTLLGGSVVVVVLAAGVGWLMARRTLEPVGRASAAAHAVAEGLLATRLPVEGADEFGVWATSFNRMAAALETKIAALSEAQARERRFTADVAHELRTPVTALLAAASLLREDLGRLPIEVRRPAELLVADVARLRRLVDDLMEVSRLDGGQEALRVQRVDLRAVLDAVIAARGWRGRVAVDGADIAVVTDPRRVERILANLVANAIEHGERGVWVRITATGSVACLQVGDRGPGIAAEHLGHLFDRFYKADAARSGAGSGLGLAIVWENVRLLGGEVDVRSEVGVGTEFRVRLPVTQLLPDGEGAVRADADREE